MFSSPAAIRPTDIARDEAARGAAPRFSAVVAQRVDALRTFVICQLAGQDGGAVNARTFLEMSHGHLAVHGEQAHAAWLFGLAARVAHELARNATGRRAFSVRALSATDQLRVARGVSVKLAALSETQHDALLMAAMEEISIDDVGILLSLPVDIVRGRLDRAQRALDERVHPFLQRAA
jgi:DNA-directed RNA polymerase specialized sigma24 family protein